MDKKYSESTLMGWKKKELVSYIMNVLYHDDMQWTAVSEGLPETDGLCYICQMKWGSIMVLSFSKKHQAFNCLGAQTEEEAKQTRVDEVVAWMPMPMLYGGEKK